MTNKNIIEIEAVRPSSYLGDVVIEGYVNDSSFNVNILQDTHALDYITINDEIVWAAKPEESFANPINLELLNDFKFMVATQIRTIKATR